VAVALNVSNNILLNQNSHLLNFWCDTMLENIFLFNQCAGAGAPIQTANDKGKVYLQKEREYIARELEKAFIQVSNHLNYFVTPAYYTETIPLGLGVPTYNQIHQGRYCKMIALGKRATTLISANAPVVYSDPYNSGVDDTATVTVVTGVANAEVKLFFRVTDGAQVAGDYRYEIYPTQVTDSSGTVTIKAHRALFVKPSEWARNYVANDPNFNSPNIIDTSDVNAFVSAVDIYRVYTDNTASIELLNGDGVALDGYNGEIINHELSAFRLGFHCGGDYWCCDRPTQLRVSYLSGSPFINGYPDSELYESCVALACANMETDMGQMSYWMLNQYIRWHGALMESSKAGSIPVATQRQSNGLFGARAGQILASDTVLSRRIEKAHKFF
jgi:hypothetical protein